MLPVLFLLAERASCIMGEEDMRMEKDEKECEGEFVQFANEDKLGNWEPLLNCLIY